MAQVQAEQISSILRRVPDGGAGRLEMMCPRCETWTDAGMGFKNLQMVKEHIGALNPIVKCLVKSCGHTFSPRWLMMEDRT